MAKPLRLALVADTFYPLRSSAAVQLRDLAREFAEQGHELTVICPAAGQCRFLLVEEVSGFKVVRIRTATTKDVGYVRRTINEFLMPFVMARSLRRADIPLNQFDGVIWYSPSIFFAPLAAALKKASGCSSYLIIRDIFPEWAVDMGLMGRGLPYSFFKAVASYQYSVADTIGVQTEGNKAYLNAWANKPGHELQVLANWLRPAVKKPCSIDLSATPLAGRTVFVYAGNMGVAQGMDIVLGLASKLDNRADVGFLFVGRGSEAARLRSEAEELGLSNTLFYDEIDPDEISSLYKQCAVGIVALDPRHKSHNIPGKFLTYMQSGLPVLANVNAGNDLVSVIAKNEVGIACEEDSLEALVGATETLLHKVGADNGISARCRRLFENEYSASQAVAQIVDSFSRRAVEG